MNTVDTKSQVCSLVWANEYKELVSAHGYANNEVTIWKYPTMVIQFHEKKKYYFRPQLFFPRQNAFVIE